MKEVYHLFTFSKSEIYPSKSEHIPKFKGKREYIESKSFKKKNISTKYIKEYKFQYLLKYFPLIEWFFMKIGKRF